MATYWAHYPELSVRIATPVIIYFKINVIMQKICYKFLKNEKKNLILS